LKKRIPASCGKWQKRFLIYPNIHIQLTKQSHHVSLKLKVYLSEIDRRQAEIERQEDRRIASRSHRMELIIIALIVGEIVIGIFGIWLGFREGKEQAAILERVEKAAMRAGSMNLVCP
jgi:hypothetical protein